MSKFKTIRYEDAGLCEPVAIMGLPTIGLVGSILSSYVVKEMKMGLVAGMTSDCLPPYALISDGLPYPPVRVFGRKGSESGVDLVVLTSEVTPKPEDSYDMAVSILDMLQELNVKRTFVLEGASQQDNPKTVACGTEKDTLTFVGEHGITSLSDGLVRGVTGVMLYEGRDRGMDIVALMCPANPNMPDPRASAATLTILSTLIPGLDIPTEPLTKEADAIDERIRSEMHNMPAYDGARNLYG